MRIRGSRRYAVAAGQRIFGGIEPRVASVGLGGLPVVIRARPEELQVWSREQAVLGCAGVCRIFWTQFWSFSANVDTDAGPQNLSSHTHELRI